MLPLDHVWNRAYRAWGAPSASPSQAQAGDLLTVQQAVKLLGMRQAAAKKLLRDRGLIVHFEGRARVIRSQLLQAYDEAQADGPEDLVEEDSVDLDDWSDLDL